ncbi:hypothetical protein BWQ96_05451 [Gracilariopsis chorda]|uniref:DUF1517 domain-containing protein n=1 Tax=Gracilariopsis chorda TaxID=448386 RepID=A0A2V3IRM7_9FLOR|nr:hypothetical protein BWQ96_05451 [Gracilariopsis chorda]|eukprot:PXF44781.1 hypothetical protein BWQ96_05451 [Gracilariopsis chorda]
MPNSAFLVPTPLQLRPLHAASRPLCSRARPISTSTLYTPPTASLNFNFPSPAKVLQRVRDDTLIVAKHASKAVAAVALIAALVLPPDMALAASGGRIGGSSFRSSPVPSRVAPAPRYGGGYGGGYSGGYGGGLFGAPGGVYFSPIILPFGGFGFGGIGSLILFATAAAFVADTLRTKSEESDIQEAVDPNTSLTTVKIGLLANARDLQRSLDTLGRSADTSSVSGLKYVLDETAMSLLRNPDYWIYGSLNNLQSRLSTAESEFSRIVLEERLKLDEETLSNSAGRIRELGRASATTQDYSKAPGEYIVVSLIVAATGNLARKLPRSIASTAELEQTLRVLAGTSTEALQGIEVIWAPQSLRDTLSERELLTDHPELKRL